MQREPVVAGMFYPADPDRCAAEVAGYMKQAGEAAPEDGFFAGLVPHAGWTYSGPVAAKTFAALARSGAPTTLVILGAVHTWGVRQPALYARGLWNTPLGPLEVDESLAAEVLEQANGRIVEDPRAHSQEHSIEVQLPFVRYLFPEARIVPLMVPPVAESTVIGDAVAQAARPRGRNVFLLGSSDLTHYGPRYGLTPRGTGPEALAWARENDRRLLDTVIQMRAAEVVARATDDYSACGAGAIAATVAAAGALGAKRGLLLEQTTSYDVHPMGGPTDFVGYAAVVF